MTIRSATTDDIEGIRRVAQASWRNDYPEILSRETVEEVVEEWYDSERIKTEIKSTDALIPVVEIESDGEIIGFAQAVWDANTGTILRLYVRPDYRGQGIGTNLLEWTVDALADENVKQVETLVLSENALGNEFYQNFGFEKTKENQTAIGEETYSENTYTMHV